MTNLGTLSPFWGS